jgi:regulator of RNase E activity RraA
MHAAEHTKETSVIVADNTNRHVLLDSCVVSDALDALGLDYDPPGMTALWAGAKIAGQVLTVQLDDGPAPANQPRLHLGVAAIERATAGTVIVLANEGRTGMGSWGGMLTRAALSRGVAGVVLDGSCRDIDEARELGFPVFGRGVTTKTARGRIHEVSCGEPVQIRTTVVRTGDWVFADGSGVVFVPAGEIQRVRRVAERLARKENLVLEHLASFTPLADIFGANYEDMLAPEDSSGPG